jgi:UDPglucose 6-dehydrogenase
MFAIGKADESVGVPAAMADPAAKIAAEAGNAVAVDLASFILVECLLDLDCEFRTDFLVSIDVEDPVMGRLLLGEVFLLTEPSPGVGENAGPEMTSERSGLIRGSGVDDKDFLRETSDAFDRSGDVLFFVERDDGDAQGGTRHMKKLAYGLNLWEKSSIMRVAIIGTGYVGLVAGACFADSGNAVVCLDIDPKKVDSLKRGEIPIYEPGLEDLVKRGSREGRLSFTTSFAEAVSAAEVVFLAVGTPPLPDGSPDTRYLEAASRSLGKAMAADKSNEPRIIVNKSTVPIGSHRIVAEWIRSETEKPFEVVSNPEFLKEGSAVDDFLRPDRVVIGTESEVAFRKMADLYAPFVRQGNPIIHMDTVSAEITKYACNAFLATRISFMNELSRLCEKVGGDVEEVRKGMASDVRIGKHFLYAGLGYGGSCFPKDVKALISTGERFDTELEIVRAVDSANIKQRSHFIDAITRRFGGELRGKTFAIWGIAFKPNTDDLREAPSLDIIRALLSSGAKVRAFDPVAMENAKVLLGEDATINKDGLHFASSAYDAIDGADALVLATEWNEFRHPDWKRVRLGMQRSVIFDGRNVYDPAKIVEMGFEYVAVGRGKYKA